MATVEEALATFERNIHAQTGRTVEAWRILLQEGGQERHGQMVSWLKSEWNLSHSHANHIAKRTLEAAAPRADDDPVAHIFSGGKEDLRPLYQQLVQEISACGPDVEIAPKKSNVSFRRRKQFALAQPSTQTRLDLGLILRDTPAAGRLEASGSFNAMFTHRIRLSTSSDLDEDLRSWVKQAYDQA